MLNKRLPSWNSKNIVTAVVGINVTTPRYINQPALCQVSSNYIEVVTFNICTPLWTSRFYIILHSMFYFDVGETKKNLLQLKLLLFIYVLKNSSCTIQNPTVHKKCSFELPLQH